ncbi:MULTISPECIES: GtrA family protein [unclassified Mesorhizobium]|uniref:GtrA family protein n=1 Tax=unclassified Mesorhizobium TaxID=325217 RepID=UPI000FCBCED6|nr:MULTISPECIES: GtrA family protein [unclassified Mesorhizobium]RUW34111.1 GtrA family protein [Mesorhizobium sp. M1E.F.Ca.ET.041.01.1.1]RWD84813.1 MAG: GtrA family protein [Mesorhizobium sp.]RWD91575.1 MAG: GtrA family protein [Mesorhizobium sp.]TIV54349.1 MAG: GtrA family protein [Mesorhizobium sp.]
MLTLIRQHRLSRFAVIGGAATLVYALCALLLSGGGRALSATSASVIAYVIAGVFSYAGHKYFTFVSAGAHRFELPRFLLLNAMGLAIAAALPGLLTGRLGMPAAVPVLLTCVAVPLVNYIMLGRWVFRDA